MGGGRGRRWVCEAMALLLQHQLSGGVFVMVVHTVNRSNLHRDGSCSGYADYYTWLNVAPEQDHGEYLLSDPVNQMSVHMASTRGYQTATGSKSG